MDHGDGAGGQAAAAAAGGPQSATRTRGLHGASSGASVPSAQPPHGTARVRAFEPPPHSALHAPPPGHAPTERSGVHGSPLHGSVRTSAGHTLPPPRGCSTIARQSVRVPGPQAALQEPSPPGDTTHSAGHAVPVHVAVFDSSGHGMPPLLRGAVMGRLDACTPCPQRTLHGPSTHSPTTQSTGHAWTLHDTCCDGPHSASTAATGVSAQPPHVTARFTACAPRESLSGSVRAAQNSRGGRGRGRFACHGRGRHGPLPVRDLMAAHVRAAESSVAVVRSAEGVVGAVGVGSNAPSGPPGAAGPPAEVTAT